MATNAVQYALGRMVKAIKDFEMIKEGDRVAVGVSGGKDSVLMYHLLNQYKKFSDINFEVVGITLKLGFPNMDFEPLAKWSEEMGYEYHTVPTDVYEILKANANDKGQLPCSLCSKFKKALLIDAAKKNNCNIVSMGHHLDDGIETLFMNAIFNGYLGTFKPTMYLDQTDVDFIRPFIYLHEDEIVRAGTKAAVPIVPSTCPADKHTKREDVKQWLNSVYEQFPTAVPNFKNILMNEEKVNLWSLDKHKLTKK